MKKLLSLLMLTILLLMSVSCNAENGDTSPPDTPFPMQKPRTGQCSTEQMEALIEGVLVLDEDGYLRLESGYGDGNYLIIWPYGFSRRTEGEDTLVIDRDGEVVARVGDTVELGGGETPEAEYYLTQNLPDDVEGPYWIVGDFSEDESPSSEQSEKYAEIFEKYKDNPELFDMAIYAEHYGIDIDEAIRRFEIMDKARPLGAELEKNEAETFAGFWIEHEPEFRLVAAFTEKGEETIAPYRRSYPELADVIKVVLVEFTYTELLNAQQEVHDTLESLGIYAGSATYVMENRVSVYVIDRAAVDEAVQNGELTIPDCVKIVVIE